MSSPTLLRTAESLGLAAMLLVAAACSTRTAVTGPLATLDVAGDQQALVTLDREIAQAGQDSGQLTAIANRLIGTLRAPETTAYAKQAISERLGVLPPGVLMQAENASLFAAMLSDPRQVNLARLILDRIPGDYVDGLLVRSLDQAPADAQLAVIQSIGNRRIASAVPALAKQLNSGDARLAAATTKALGQIGTAEALEALRAAPAPGSAEVIAARLAAAERLGGRTARSEYETLAAMPAAPAHLRAAAQRGLLFTDPDSAAERFVTALASNDHVLKPVVVESIYAHPAPQLAATLAAQLGKWDARTQEAVITALGLKGDPAAVDAVAAAVQHEDAAVRAAAITALGRLPGSPDTAALLAQIASGNRAADAKLARLSLSQVNGPGVAEAVVTGATFGPPALREVYLEQIASRYMVEAVQLLLRMRIDPEPRVRVAALGSLAEIAPPSELPAIVDWALAANTSAEQSRALRAMAEVALRNADVERRVIPIIGAIEQAPSPVAARLMPALARVGGADAAAAAARLALREDAPVATAAVATLGRWNDRGGLLPLVEVAEKAPLEQARAAAVQNATRFLMRSRELPRDELAALVGRLLAVARDEGERARLAYLLARCDSPEALALAERLATEPALAREASDAVLAIKANQAGVPAATSSPQAGEVQHLFDRNTRTRWGANAALGQSLTVDFHSTRPIRQLILDNAGTQWGLPDQLEVFVTDDVKQPGEPRASVAGQPGKTTIDLPADTRGRYLVIRHATDKPDEYWMICELVVE